MFIYFQEGFDEDFSEFGDGEDFDYDEDEDDDDYEDDDDLVHQVLFT